MEDPRDWEQHRDGVFASLNPDGHLEHVLAEQIAWGLWKLIRVAHYQAMATRDYIDQARNDLSVAAAYAAGTLAKGEFPELDPAHVARAEALRVLPGRDTLDKIMRGACPERSRRKAHLHRLYIQTLHELEAIQTRRQGGHSPLARLDIGGPPGL